MNSLQFQSKLYEMNFQNKGWMEDKRRTEKVADGFHWHAN